MNKIRGIEVDSSKETPICAELDERGSSRPRTAADSFARHREGVCGALLHFTELGRSVVRLESAGRARASGISRGHREGAELELTS
eukprot:scaffold300_cov258-Pinguiococcus_pyrenoidosus.AAC.74